ncbi:TadE/TadG family type IV pilus assembly protein [Streptomyces alkaliphilus]|uniref:TadE/TadG family type IV pilus assembly protein n=1 Tax=Streptomyces alkaliphilus TaxID=1472722 RepID=UPI00117F4A5C|nr:TadE family protein [Streptomyces alkaliphilus]MQS08205.1 pilus assembly protein [Streptomyces alkaliphilus]
MPRGNAPEAPGGEPVDRSVRRSDDRGVTAVEMVLLAPLIITFVLVLAGLGQMVSGRNAVDGAARDAARAGSLERTAGEARAASTSVVGDQLRNVCVSGSVQVRSTGSGHEPGSLYTVEVSCRVRALAMLGLPVTTTVSSTSASPIDPYRRSG